MRLNPDANFAQLFEEAAERSPDAAAVIDGERTWTYAAMHRDVLTCARWLLDDQGVRPDDNVCVRMDNSYALLVACLAINYVGACWMPLSFEVPRIEHMLADAEARVVITALPEGGEGAAGGLSAGDAARLRRYNREHVSRDSRLFLVYSSGSTGTPKGILQTQRAFLRGVEWRFTQQPNGPDTRMGAYIFFIWEAFRPLLCGGAVYVVPKLTLLDGERLVAFLSQHRIDEIQFTPSAARVLVDHLERRPAALPHLTCVWLCGEIVYGELARRMDAVFGAHIRLLNLYSISEAPDLGIGDLRAHLDREVQPLTRFIDGFACGLQTDDGRDELVLSAPTVSTLGYLGRDDLNATKFDWSGEPASYHTGDRGSFEGGELVVRGRCDFMKKVRGYSVQLDELEQAVQRLTGAVNAVVRYDEATSELHAFVQQPTLDDVPAIYAALRAELPAYAVPSYVTVVQEDIDVLDPISGKRQRGRLGRAAHSFGPLGDLWADVLKRPPGATDDFFVVGGDSLSAVALLGKVNARYGLDLRIDDFYAHPTITALQALIQGRALDEQSQRAEALVVMDRDVAALAAAHRDTRFEPGTFKAVRDGERVLITGASGYLGTWLVEALTRDPGRTVYCLARDPARWRAQAAARYGAELPWQRIHCITGDLEADRFGLGAAEFDRWRDHFDVIVHAAGLVNFSVSYARLQQTNLRGLETLLHWATGASLHFISSNAIYPSGYGDCRAAQLDDLRARLQTPYGRSKWVLEKALRALGVPAACYRLGNIGPHPSGAANPNDAQTKLLIACARLGARPDRPDFALEFTPLEQVIEALLRWDRPEAVNVVNARRLPLAALPLEASLAWEDWLAAAGDVDPVLPQVLQGVERWLGDENHYESAIGPFDVAERAAAALAYLRS